MIRLKYIPLILLYLFILPKLTDNKEFILSETPKLLTLQKTFKTGDSISLFFSTQHNISSFLYCSNSYGSTLLTAQKVEENKIVFNIPHFISNKRGTVNWKLIQNGKNISGNLNIIPKDKPKTLETYLGPPSIEAGEKDFAMMVVIPTDSNDNPLAQNTEVFIKNHFLNSQNKNRLTTQNLITYKNIYAPQKSGRILLSSNCLGLDSKEYSINVVPAISTNFKIFAQRHHEYADGNQITTLKTSVLNDAYGNIVSDGSFVEFYITNLKGNILKTTGTTIDGVATAKIIHPDHEEQWSIKAYVIGISESNTISLSYKKVIHSFDVKFSNNNRTLKVGPLKSFMNQMIPDGLEVKLSIYKEDKLIDEYLKESREGFVNFILDKNIFINGIYTIKITTAGITQTYKNKKLW